MSPVKKSAILLGKQQQAPLLLPPAHAEPAWSPRPVPDSRGEGGVHPQEETDTGISRTALFTNCRFAAASLSAPIAFFQQH